MSTPTPPDLPTPAAVPAGYDPLFLSTALPVPLPIPPASAAVRELPSTHFTVVLDLTRRLAVATGVNLDGSALLDLDRGDDWHFDARHRPISRPPRRLREQRFGPGSPGPPA